MVAGIALLHRASFVFQLARTSMTHGPSLHDTRHFRTYVPLRGQPFVRSMILGVSHSHWRMHSLTHDCIPYASTSSAAHFRVLKQRRAGQNEPVELHFRVLKQRRAGQNEPVELEAKHRTPYESSRRFQSTPYERSRGFNGIPSPSAVDLGEHALVGPPSLPKPLRPTDFTSTTATASRPN
eukprot:scaffold284_cov157-Pinguiococcus_pyrenoidosus.AAC.1